ncbi:30S ribosomal protein S18 [Candidatus Kaiserbacteria bacterium RIFCSPLOWO2_12_FULL_53_8]|uniref:30S ribosomal protein S18 n=1 Tax=Candidatus Kaiserbacteria bacterium RIFCSPLOWO2_12_FULL_53_8 TaxID=1798529 RepID=A0A1F6G1I8_9BACT|nr:MAG: 30S ribosomal protein S18 [Candidatus Kaiserbacteria bacterium RIFCSPLOWO2_12_FULL_53_8]
MPPIIKPNTGSSLPPGQRPCPFTKAGVTSIDWKDFPTLKNFTDYFGNIKKRYYTGTSLRHQKMLKQAIERARFMGLLPYRK